MTEQTGDIPAVTTDARGRASALRSGLYVFGLDLGELQDYSALSILEVVPTLYEIEANLTPNLPLGWQDVDPTHIPGPPITMNLRWIDRFPLRTPYPKIVGLVEGRLRQVPGDKILAVDATGVGRAVVDLFADRGLVSVNISITGGAQVTLDGEHPGEVSVPKRDLVHGMLVALQTDRLRFSPRMPYAEDLNKEFGSFRMNVNPKTGNPQFQAWRDGDHDDILLSLACAVWTAEREVEELYTQAVASLKMAAIEGDLRASISPY